MARQVVGPLVFVVDKSCQRQTLYKTYTSRYPLPQVQFSNEEKICQ